MNQIDNITFLVLEADRHRVRILELEAKSHKDVLESNSVVHMDKTGDIQRMRSDKDKIYLLVKVGYEIEL